MAFGILPIETDIKTKQNNGSLFYIISYVMNIVTWVSIVIPYSCAMHPYIAIIFQPRSIGVQNVFTKCLGGMRCGHRWGFIGGVPNWECVH